MDAVTLATRIVAEAANAPLLSVGIPGGGLLVEAILDDLLSVQDAQAEAIARIGSNVDRLIQGPWRTARLILEEAKLPGRSPADKHRALTDAAAKLRDAIPLQDPRTFGCAYVCLDLALIFRLLNDSQAAVMYARRAMEAATSFVADIEMKQVHPPKYSQNLRGIIGDSAGTLGLGTLMGLLSAGLMLPSVISDNVKEIRAKLKQFDADCNAWLGEVYQEAQVIDNVATKLCGAGDGRLLELRRELPRDLHYQRGQLRTT